MVQFQLEEESFINKSENIEEKFDEIVFDMVTIDPPPQTTGSVVGHGQLADGFRLSIHNDESYRVAAARLQIGQQLFVKVQWQTPITDMKYYVENCNYYCGSDSANSIDIVKVKSRAV